ncbi:MAG TPA: protein kinase [Vicinamibacterales bacterium]|nr:protein kinase [Vicinamibacterales bacterium]
MTDPARRQRVEDLCDAALDRDERERAAFIAAACGDDHVLRGDVEALLANAHKADRFLVTRVGDLAAQIMADDQEPSLVGRRLGPHEILSRLGSGGMGEVYRARDTRLGRDVAIKVVADPFVAAPERLARFELEARVLATLNHPHIGAIYGLEEADGVRALVLELVEGLTLAERLTFGPLPLDEAVAVARQIVDALEAAHDRGVIHRDLKPANIKITSDGTVKVLDFGLAKMFAREIAAGEESPTLPPSFDPSRDGLILGTAAYMSPEQARGKPIDKRTDIWAFGCVLYEMVTARPAFGGESSSDTIAAVLEHAPDWSALPVETPLGIRRLLQRCLEKDPRRRLRDIGDARLDIDDTFSANATADTTAPRRVRRTAGAAAGVFVLVLASLVTWQLQRSEYFWRNPLDDATVTRLTDFDGADHHAAISPGGDVVAFLSDRAGAWDVWVTQVATGDVLNLTKGSVEELRNPATRTVGFSPDGSRVVLWSRARKSAGGGVVDSGWTVPTLGGQLQPTWKGLGISELAWASNGRVVYHPSTDGDPMFVTEPDEKEGKQIYAARAGLHNHFPIWSPDGAFIYFVQGKVLDSTFYESDVWRIPPAGGQPERMTFHNTRVTFPTLLDDRTLLYLATDTDGFGPWIYAMDVKRRIPHRISTGVEPYTSLAASADGRRLVATTLSRSTTSLWRVPVEGREVAAATPIRLPTTGGLSPRRGDGYIVYRALQAGTDGLWKLLDTGEATALWNGLEGRVVSGAAIEPGGGHVAFVIQKQGRTQLYLVNADGTGGARRVADELDVRGAPAWSPDGQSLAIAANRAGEPNLFKVPLNGGTPVPLVKEYSTNPIWAPSGRFLVYFGADVGTNVSVKAVSKDGAAWPLPRLTLTRGDRLAFLQTDDALIVLKGNVSQKDFYRVDLTTGHERQLTRLGRELAIGDFDLSPDAREIIFDRIREESEIVLFNLIDR